MVKVSAETGVRSFVISKETNGISADKVQPVKTNKAKQQTMSMQTMNIQNQQSIIYSSKGKVNTVVKTDGSEKGFNRYF